MNLKEKIALQQLATEWMAYGRHLEAWSRAHPRDDHAERSMGHGLGYQNAATGLRRELKRIATKKKP